MGVLLRRKTIQGIICERDANDVGGDMGDQLLL